MSPARVWYLSLFAVVTILGIACSGCHPPSDGLITPVNVSHDTADSNQPSLAVGPDGTAYLAWHSYTSSSEQILMSKKLAGESWSEPVCIVDGGGNPRFPSIAVDRSGVLHVARQEWVSGGSINGWVILYSRLLQGDTLSIPDTVYLYGLSLVPAITVDDSGNVHLLWNGYPGYLCYARKPASATWQDFYAFPYGNSFLRHFEAKPDGLGGLHVVAGLADGITYWHRTPEGAWSDSLTISSHASPFSSSDPVLAVAGDNSLHVLWQDAETSARGFVYRERTPSGDWLPPASPYGQQWDLSKWTFPRVDASVVKEDNGQICAIWCGQGGIGYGTKSGDKWSSPVEVSYDSFALSCPGAATEPDGSLSFAWCGSTHSARNEEIFCIEFKP